MALNFNTNAFLSGMGLQGLAPLLGATPQQPPQAAPGTGQNPLQGLVQQPQPEEPVHDIGTVTRPEPHKGMFGVKGTLRDILGVVGDAFLVNSGRNAVYAPQRHQEKISDAMGNDFMDNPMNAVQRLQEAGFGKEAQELYNKVQEQEIARQKAAADSAYKGAQTTDRGYQNLGALFAAATPETFPALLEIAKRRAGGYGIDVGELPTTYEASRRFGLDAYRNNRLDQFDEEHDLRERNVNDQINDRSARRQITIRGQDVSAATSRANNANTTATTRRGQDIASRDRRDIAAQTDSRVRGSAGYKGKAGQIPKGTVQRNKKTGATRTWDGTKWVNG